MCEVLSYNRSTATVNHRPYYRQATRQIVEAVSLQKLKSSHCMRYTVFLLTKRICGTGNLNIREVT